MNVDDSESMPPRPAELPLLAGDGRAEDAAQRLLGQEPEVLARYLAELRAINSPLAADPEAWQQCVAQARRILLDCAVSLAEGRATVTGTEIADVVNQSGERVRPGLHLTHSIRAGMLLLDIILSALATAVAETDPAGAAEALAPTNRGRLSGREVEVLGCAARALSNRQIAGRLGITEGTVKRHLRNIFGKLDAVSRIDAVNKAVERELIAPPGRRGGA
ncbi:helix-turn-helix transcriptional regulator [Kitasatospora sp. GAS204B]|uniref:helix-turn-helix transcriptional regulator n=1 Tax=unclassified Kitasatospora TaxID=2633591 RepID=UPI002475D8D4|nr:helix-turn-helix transcriptional regulator [Kitasatospora sp. GAS204B]MDH6119610.1 ATP/maltotriose-dependent transcriptional regulator MalT [Kitasatospora sp. GAS204B]